MVGGLTYLFERHSHEEVEIPHLALGILGVLGGVAARRQAQDVLEVLRRRH